MWEMYWLERRIKSTEFAIYQNDKMFARKLTTEQTNANRVE